MQISHISKFVLWSSIGFISGVGFISVLDVYTSIFIEMLVFVISITCIILIFIFYKQQWLWCLLSTLLCFAIGIYVISSTLVKSDELKNDVGTVLTGEALVSKEIVNKEWSSDVTLSYVDGNTVLIKDAKYTELKIGSVTKLMCVIGEIDKGDFDYQRYLFMKGVEYSCSDFNYIVTGFEKSLLGELVEFRKSMENIINNIIPAPESALANGLLFGGNDRLSNEMQQKFADTGMTHIVAVSGYNVSVIVIVVMSTVIFLGVNRRNSILPAMLAVLFFVALIGFPSSGVRAAIMGSMILVAAAFGRVSHAYGAIFFTGAIMIAFSPLLLRYDVGFQLSFLATLGIVSVYSILERYFIPKNKSFGILEILLLTISAQVFVLPIIVYHFNTVSVVSLMANILILPIIPITMLVTFLTVIFGFLFYPLALIFGWMAYFLLSWEIFVVDVLSQIPWSNIEIGNINIVWFVVYYIIIGVSVYLINKKVAYEV